MVYRLGFGVTRAEARQLVSHKCIMVNGVKVNVPSYQVKPGDEIEVVEKSKKQLRITAALEISDQIGVVPWVDSDPAAVKGVYKMLPERSDLSPDINEALVVALYSK